MSRIKEKKTMPWPKKEADSYSMGSWISVAQHLANKLSKPSPTSFINAGISREIGEEWLRVVGRLLDDRTSFGFERPREVIGVVGRSQNQPPAWKK